jgi:tRNA(fMet)-specific endonuclease VapC|uniref:type II toxin-antitoxin system VapC family toxin n=1 Tax=Prosthecobacter sp. TaxID=1965333 RepID=UPI00378335A2
MVILDTNHYSELDRGSQAGALLRERLISRGEQPWLTVMTAEEVLRGRLAQIAAEKDRLLVHYDLFLNGLLTLAKWRFLPWTQAAQDTFDMLHFQRVRIGTMDLRIASLALTHNTLLLSRNLVDFQKVPGLRVENWLD